MKYMGSKSRIAKEIVPIIQSYIDKSENKLYWEPFVGGANVIEHINATHKYGSDKQEYLIALYKNLDKIETLPDFVTKEHYVEVRDSYNKKDGKFENWYIGAIGFLASYNGRFFDGGYAGIVHTKAGTVRDYYSEAKRNLEHQAEKLKDVKFNCSDYLLCRNVKGFVIYCDPPYQNTKQYNSSLNFDFDTFWQWARDMSKWNTVIVSEQEAPNDFDIMWEKEVNRTIDNNKRVKKTERLFVYHNKDV